MAASTTAWNSVHEARHGYVCEPIGLADAEAVSVVIGENREVVHAMPHVSGRTVLVMRRHSTRAPASNAEAASCAFRAE
jgi:hypothetical protein